MNTHAERMGFAGNAARLAGLLFALALLAALVVDQRPWDRLLDGETRIGVVVEGQRFQVDAGHADIIGQRAAERANQGAAAAGEATARLVSSELDALFEAMSAGLHDYADWYFSLKGEYTRLSLLLLRWGGLAMADPAVDKAMELIFGGEEWVERLLAIERSVEGMLVAQASGLRTRWLEDLLTFAQEPKPARTGSAPAAVLLLDDLAGEFAGHGSSEFLTRISATSAGAVSAGAAAPLVARLALRSSATAAGGGALTLKGAGRGAAKAGTAGASALGCAAAGPAGWACALAVGGAAWLAADWALLTVDEARNREMLVAEWEERLALLRVELEEALLARYGQAIETWHEGMRLEVERTFSPLDSLRRTQTTPRGG